MANVYDDIINGTFASLGTSATGWAAPGQSYAGQETAPDPNRLRPSSAGLPNPSPGSGLTYQQIQAQGGYNVDPLTGQLAYTQPQPNAAAAAAGQMGQGGNIPLPRPRPATPTTAMEDALISAGIRPGVPLSQQGANPGMGGAMFGNGRMSPGIPPQQPPADGSSRLPVWRGEAGQGASPQQGFAGNGYTFTRNPDGSWAQTGKMPWAQGMSPSQQYEVANAAAALAAKQRVSGLNGISSGYQIVNGQRTQPAPQYAGMSPSQVYDAVNRDAANAARAKVGKDPVNPSSGSHQDYGGTGAGSDHPYFSSGF